MNHHPTIPEAKTPGLLEKALYILQDGITLVDLDGQISYINEAAQQALLYQGGRFPEAGDCFYSYIIEERRELVRAHTEAAFGGTASRYPLNLPHKGSQNWLEIAYFPVPEEDGKTRHVCIRSRDITDKVELEKKLEAERRLQRNALIKAALDAQERQRAEIGRELHDNVNQVLTTVKLYNEICLSEASPDRNMLLRSVQQINYCIETLRSLSRNLASPIIAEMGLKESIKELSDSVEATRRTSVQFYTYGICNEAINPGLQVTLYRIAQEQLTNILKYANATHVEVVLVGTSDSVALKIQDNGEGFDAEEKRKGVGITNMITRTEAWGGQIEFTTAPGAGCTLMVEFPLNGKAE